MLQTIVSFLICTVSTTVGAISGIGGGVIIKPVLDATSSMSVSSISFLSGCTVLAMSIVSLMRSSGSGVKVEPRRGTLLAVGAAAGGILGKALFELIKNATGSDGMVGTVQSILMVALTLGVYIYVINKSRIKTLDVHNALACIAIGLILGLLSAFLGIGGGPINLAVLYYFLSMDTKTAAINSIYIILFSQITSFASTFIKGNVPQFSIPVMIAMVLGGIIGGFIGRGFSKKMDNGAVDKLFKVLLITITLISCYNLYRYASML